jgi:predicted transcriptional regulator
MKTTQYTVRVPAAVDKAMQKLAAQQNVTPYEMLQRCVKAGVAAQANPPTHGASDRELVTELASVSTGLAHVERMLDRALFTACASYCYARSAALAAGNTDADIAAEVNPAYERQRRLSQEAQS